MLIHVNDSLCTDSKEDLEALCVKIHSRYQISILGQITKYILVTYKWGKDKDGSFVIMSMETNANKIVSYFERVWGKSEKMAMISGFQNTVLSKNEGEIEMLDKYRSLVDKVLFYTINIGLLDCANSVRDLVHHVLDQGLRHWKAKEHMLGDLEGKELHGLNF